MLSTEKQNSHANIMWMDHVDGPPVFQKFTTFKSQSYYRMPKNNVT